MSPCCGPPSGRFFVARFFTGVLMGVSALESAEAAEREIESSPVAAGWNMSRFGKTMRKPWENGDLYGKSVSCFLAGNIMGH